MLKEKFKDLFEDAHLTTLRNMKNKITMFFNLSN